MVLGLRDYVNNNKFPGVVLGLSGGIDSALVAAIATDAFGPSMVQSIMLPSNFTGQDSLNDAKDTANLLKINFSNLEINEAMKIVDKTLGKFNGKSFSRYYRGKYSVKTKRFVTYGIIKPLWLYGISNW